MRPHGTRFLTLTVVAASAAMALASCSSSSTSSGGSATKSPILIGTSLSLTGDFSVDGQAFERGYNLWVKEINKSGGLLGHKVTLKIVNDNSDPGTVTTNYTQLISADHAAFVFGPVWMLWHRMWLIFFGYVIVAGVLEIALRGVGASSGATSLVGFLFALLIGFEAPTLRRFGRARRCSRRRRALFRR